MICFCSTFPSFANANFHKTEQDGWTVLFACCISLRAGNSTLQLGLLLFHSFSELKVFIKHISSEIHGLKGGNQLNLFTEAYYGSFVLV